MVPFNLFCLKYQANVPHQFNKSQHSSNMKIGTAATQQINPLQKNYSYNQIDKSGAHAWTIVRDIVAFNCILYLNHSWLPFSTVSRKSKTAKDMRENVVE